MPSPLIINSIAPKIPCLKALDFDIQSLSSKYNYFVLEATLMFLPKKLKKKSPEVLEIVRHKNGDV